LAPPPKRYVEKAMTLWFSGSVLLVLFATTDIYEIARWRSNYAIVPVIVYLLFGKWPPVVALLSSGLLFSLLALLEKRRDPLAADTRGSRMHPAPVTGQPRPTVESGRQLHRLLGAGVSALAAVFLGMTYFGAAPLLPAGTAPLAARYGPGAASLAILLIALFVFKPRVPDRLSTQTIDEFWASPEVGAKVVLLWFLLEGAGILAAVGYLLTGEPLPALAMALAVGAYWWCRPSLFLNG
jgi:hypothetical protein